MCTVKQKEQKQSEGCAYIPARVPEYFYYMLVTFYRTSLLGINTPSFFLAILIFFLNNNTSCYFQFQDCPRLLCSQQEPGSLCAISFLLFFMPKGHPV